MDATKVTSGIPLSDYILEVTQSGRDEYVAKHPYPIFLIETISDEEISSELDDFKFATQRLSSKLDSGVKPSIEEITAKIRDSSTNLAVLTIKKRDSKFQSIITLGRAPKSDLLVNVASVSKFHCYFTHNARENIWHISDADAANGTYLDGNRLEANTKARIDDGAGVRLGFHIRGRFFRAPAFYDYVTTLLESIAQNDS